MKIEPNDLYGFENLGFCTDLKCPYCKKETRFYMDSSDAESQEWEDFWGLCNVCGEEYQVDCKLNVKINLEIKNVRKDN